MVKEKVKKIKQNFWFNFIIHCQDRGYCTFCLWGFKKRDHLELLKKRLVEDEVEDDYWNLKTPMKECMLNQMPLNQAFLKKKTPSTRHQMWEDLIFSLFCILYFCYLLFFNGNHCLKTARWKFEKKNNNNNNCVLVRFPPCSGETTNRKCLFASIFLNVNCERGEVKRDRRSLRLSESHPQSYCSLAKNDAKHSLKPIYVLVQPQRN